MKILHTSDWHIGRSLYTRKRYEEFARFLTWLVETIHAQQVDVLLVAGDLFDTSAPSNRAQELYYRFLNRVVGSSCRHIVITAGNHDSPSFLNAPRELLRTFNVQVIGSISACLEDEVLILRDPQGVPELIVCAVPYLRERDIREAEAGESLEDKARKLVEGIRLHYAQVCALAERQRAALGRGVPLVAMGHLFTMGGQTVEGEGLRELYVGSLAHVAAGIFPETIDYLALGHLHVPQKVDGSPVRRYSGSPLAMSFGEARQQKSLCLVEFVGQNASVSLINVPVFQPLESIRGDLDEMIARINQLAASQSTAWLELDYTGAALIPDLRDRLESALQGTTMELLRVKDRGRMDRILQQSHESETLSDLNEREVFQRCLEAHAVPEAQREELLGAFQEIITALHETDANAE